MTDDLVAFLRARLDEDERNARAAEGDPVFDGTGIVIERNRARGFPDRAAGLVSPVATHIARHDPARVLADVDAKRRIVDRCDAALGMDDGYGAAFLAERVLRDLAAPYRAHPDYRPEWAPDAEG